MEDTVIRLFSAPEQDVDLSDVGAVELHMGVPKRCTLMVALVQQTADGLELPHTVKKLDIKRCKDCVVEKEANLSLALVRGCVCVCTRR